MRTCWASIVEAATEPVSWFAVSSTAPPLVTTPAACWMPAPLMDTRPVPDTFAFCTTLLLPYTLTSRAATTGAFTTTLSPASVTVLAV